MSMWSLMKSPLLLGTDMTFTANPHLKQSILSIVGNKQVIDINQDPLGVQARRVSSVPGPVVPASAITDADVLLVIAACSESRSLQKWRHNHTVDAHGGTGKGPLWTVDTEGTRWCATSISAGMWNLVKCDEPMDPALEVHVQNISLCQPGSGSYHHVCDKRIDETIPGAAVAVELWCWI